MVRNAERLLLGARKDNFLAGIEIWSIQEYETKMKLSQWDKNEAFDFLNRLLEFVSRKVKMETGQLKPLQFRCSYPMTHQLFIEQGDTKGWENFEKEKLLRQVECVKVQSEPEWFNEQKHIFVRQK